MFSNYFDVLMLKIILKKQTKFISSKKQFEKQPLPHFKK
jgi:hypothetical protein